MLQSLLHLHLAIQWCPFSIIISTYYLRQSSFQCPDKFNGKVFNTYILLTYILALLKFLVLQQAVIPDVTNILRLDISLAYKNRTIPNLFWPQNDLNLNIDKNRRNILVKCRQIRLIIYALWVPIRLFWQRGKNYNKLP